VLQGCSQQLWPAAGYGHTIQLPKYHFRFEWTHREAVNEFARGKTNPNGEQLNQMLR
jgi:hypothetical protein